MGYSNKAKNRILLALIGVLVGVTGEMDYQDAVRTDQAAKELRQEQAAKWTTYQINR